jgi:exodeoxyribonuclease VII large subunit
LAVPDAEELGARTRRLEAALLSETLGIVERGRWRLQTLVRTLRLLSPRASLDSNRHWLDALTGRLDQTMRQILKTAHGRMAIAHARLEATSPLATLGRGYAIVRGREGRVVRSVGAVVSGDRLNIQVSDGEIAATAE